MVILCQYHISNYRTGTTYSVTPDTIKKLWDMESDIRKRLIKSSVDYFGLEMLNQVFDKLNKIRPNVLNGN